MGTAALVGVAAGPAGQSRPRRPVRVVWTGPKLGAVRVANTHGCAATVSGTPLPPVRPERMI